MSPTKALSPCTIPLCPHPGTIRGRCPMHARTVDLERGSATDRGYGPRWRTIRREFLAANPTCVDCGGDAEVPDHWPRSRRELAADPTIDDPDDPRFLVARCIRCHNRSTRRRGK